MVTLTLSSNVFKKMRKKPILKDQVEEACKPTIWIFPSTLLLEKSNLLLLSKGNSRKFSLVLYGYNFICEDPWPVRFLLQPQLQSQTSTLVPASTLLKQLLNNWKFPQAELQLDLPLHDKVLLRSDAFRTLFEQDLIPFYVQFADQLFSDSFCRCSSSPSYSEFDIFSQPLGSNRYLITTVES